MTTDSPSLSVAICTRSRPAELQRCLTSLESVADKLHEVLVSTDGIDVETDEVALAYRDRLPSLTLIRGPRLGLAANRNACVEWATGDYILYLDDDARLDATLLERAMPLARRDRLVTGFEYRRGEKVTAHEPNFLGFLRRPPGKAHRCIVINATIFPRTFLAQRGFDPFFRFGSEEADIAMLATHRGLKIVPVEAPTHHDHVPRVRRGNEAAAMRSRAYLSGRRFRTYEKSWLKLLTWAFVGPVHALVTTSGKDGIWGGLKAYTGTLRAYLVGALVTRPEVRATRPTMPNLTVSVVVPTYARPYELRRCLTAISALNPSPDEIIVVVRRGDHPSSAVAEEFPETKVVEVDMPGQVAALRAGFAVVASDVVAIVDDDAVPRVDWLRWLLLPYGDSRVGAVGGRDIVHHESGVEEAPTASVGVITPFGRPIGRHHLGVGVARSVHFLKGANCSFRRELLATPADLRGIGAQVGNDLAMSLAVLIKGRGVVYDPRALVDHFPAARYDEDARNAPNPIAIFNGAYNVGYTISSLLPRLRIRRLAYSVLVGDRSSVGMLRALWALVTGQAQVAKAGCLCIRASYLAYRDARRRPLRMEDIS